MRYNYLTTILFLFTILFFTQGCSNTEGREHASLITLYLVNQSNQPLAGVPYKCETMTRYSRTADNGAFSFYAPEQCTFDFLGFDGSVNFDPLDDEVIYIVDYLLEGKRGIPYECTNFHGRTYGEGQFEYEADDICQFYL